MIEVISRETRWFLPDDKMLPVTAWFESLPGSGRLEGSQSFPRQDYYLKMPGVEDIGIKIREPKKDGDSGKIKSLFELKRLISEKEPLKFANNNNGYSGKWQKLSYELSGGSSDLILINPELLSSDNNWIRVDKDRILIKYDSANQLIVEGSTNIREGCGIELVKIKIDNSVHYSFGLEAFSESGKKLDNNFYDCCDLVFHQIGLTGLALDHSFSYPGFLVKMI